jgi:hypothetical protein
MPRNPVACSGQRRLAVRFPSDAERRLQIISCGIIGGTEYDDGSRSNVPGRLHIQTAMGWDQAVVAGSAFVFGFIFAPSSLHWSCRSHVEQRETNGSRFIPSNPALATAEGHLKGGPSLLLEKADDGILNSICANQAEA